MRILLGVLSVQNRSDLYGITNNRRRKKVKTDKNKPPFKTKVMALLSKSNVPYGMGAAVVIVGAFKITHIEFSL
jgi:hypothetical protein